MGGGAGDVTDWSWPVSVVLGVVGEVDCLVRMGVGLGEGDVVLYAAGVKVASAVGDGVAIPGPRGAAG